MISAVLFDADGVVQFPGRFIEHLTTSYRWSAAKCEGFFRKIFRECPAYQKALEGEGDILSVLAAELPGADWPLGPERFAAEWFDLHIVVDERALAVVAAVRRKGLVCALASNQERRRAAYMDEMLGYRRHFDRTFYSCAFGCTKPKREYFAAIIEALGVPPDELLLIDDIEANVEAARALCMRASVYARGDDMAAIVRAHGVAL
jgi:putative hydrolase of the HAD superfamily